MIDFDFDFDFLEAYEEPVRKATQELDFWRLLFIRSRRVLLLSVRLLENFEMYTAWVTFLDGYLRTLALYQACVLLPRFLINILYVGQHMQGPVSHDMIVRCWEIAYDFGWIMNGVLAAFILVGSLAPLAVYLPVITPSYQLCVHTIRFLMDDCYGKTNEENYANLMRLVIRMGVSICMVLTNIAMLVGSTNPVIPFLAAVLAVVVTLFSKILAKNLVSNVVPDEGSGASSHARLGLFASEPDTDILEQNEAKFPLVLHEKSW